MGVILACFFCILLIGLFVYFNTAISNLALDQVRAVNKIINENEISKDVSNELFDMFQTMNEGIVVFQKGLITFSNNAFK